MLTTHTCRSSDAVKAYYKHRDYYVDGREEDGVWGGRTAARLGLQGRVGWEEFSRLADNLHPLSGERLTARSNEQRRVAMDFTFSAPKSVSLLYEYNRDPRILELFNQAIDDTMAELEQEAKTRVRRRGENGDRVTGNLVWAAFNHFETRPTKDDGLPDMATHRHVVVFNATWDGEEKRFKAVQFGDLKRDASYWEAAFHARLAHGMAQLGYGIERQGRFWEVAGIGKELRDKFSRRTLEIEKLAAELGIDDPEAKARLGATSRRNKQKELTHDGLRAYWLSRMTAGDTAMLDGVYREAATRMGNAVGDVTQRMKEAVAFALDHCFERTSVTPEKKVLGEALRHGVGAVTIDGVRRGVVREGLFTRELDGQKMASTRHVLAEESRMVAFARNGRGACRSLGKAELLSQASNAALSPDQQSAVRHIWQSRDRVIMVRGAAGTGKTTMMQTAVQGIDIPMVFLAPSGRASRGVLRGEGFSEADTLAKFLKDEKMQAQARGGAIWVDEAGLVGSRDMVRLFDTADRIGARIILQGDWKQHGSVARGAPMKVLHDYAGLPAAVLTDIKRQKGQYREAVAMIERGQVGEGLDRLDAFGWIKEIGTAVRYKILAADYLRAVSENKSALVVSPMHAEGRRITAEIRRALREQGKLGTREREFDTLVNLNWTQAQVADARRFGPEDGVVLTQYGAYRPDSVTFAAGDVLRITAGGKTKDGQHRLENGSLYTVKGFTREGDIRLANNWVVGKDYRHLALGYTVTSHSSQGSTVDRVFIGQSSESFPASNRQQLYVSVSRGREQAVIYTDDKAALAEAVKREDNRMSATELVRKPKKVFALIASRQRRLQAQACQAVIDRTRELLHAAETAHTHTRDREPDHAR
jgi:conjugative relaxase-like TrwC/TraI family protein